MYKIQRISTARRSWAVLPLIIALICCRVHAASLSPGEQSLRQAIAAMTAEFLKSDTDMKRVSELIAKDYVHTNGENGEVWDRARWISFAEARRNDLLSGRWRLDRYEISGMTLQFHGPATAVVVFLLHSSGSRLGSPYEYRHRVTQVWTQESGHWVRAAYHDSPATPAAGRVDVYAPERSVLEFEKSRRAAVASKDLKALDRMTADDLRYVDAGGIERNKAEYLEHISTENIRYNSYSLDAAAAKVFGSLAVATGTFNYDVTVDSRINKGSQYYTAVYVRVGGDWKLLIWHPTIANKP